MSVAVATPFLLSQQDRSERKPDIGKVQFLPQDWDLNWVSQTTKTSINQGVHTHNVIPILLKQKDKSPSSMTEFDEIITELRALYSECKVEGWDGYGAAPVNVESIKQALRLAMVILEEGLPVPEFAADPDGEVSLDWYGDKDSVISVSIGPTGQIAWAAELPDSSEARGACVFKGDLDDMVKQIISKISG